MGATLAGMELEIIQRLSLAYVLQSDSRWPWLHPRLPSMYACACVAREAKEVPSVHASHAPEAKEVPIVARPSRIIETRSGLCMP